MKLFRLSLVTLAVIAVFASAVPITYAQINTNPDTKCTTQFCPLAKVSNSRLEYIYNGTNGLSDFLNKIFIFAISLGAILAVLRLGWAGYLYMTTDSWGSKGHAREVITDVVLGLLLLLGMYLILKQINPELTKFKVIDDLRGLVTSPPCDPSNPGC